MDLTSTLTHKLSRPWLIILLLLTTFGLYTFWAMLPLNLLMVRQLPLLMDVSYTATVHLAETNIPIDLASCQQNSGSSACVHALITSINNGLSLEELTPYLEGLTAHPEQQVIVASYAGEIWYRTQRKRAALTVWQNWLLNEHKIIKAHRLYEANHLDETLIMLESIDLGKRINLGVQRGMLIHILVDVAREATRSEDYELAEYFWQKAIVQYPERAGYHFNLAMVLQKQQKFEEALLVLQDTVELNPDEVQYQLRLALAWEKQGYIVEAEETATAVLMLDPDNEQAQALLKRIEP